MTCHMHVRPNGQALLIATGTTRAIATQRNCPDPATWATAKAAELGYELVGKSRPGRKKGGAK